MPCVTMLSLLYLLCDSLMEIPDRVNLRNQLSSTRLQGMPTNPMRIENSQDIPLTYTQTLDDTRFLLYDSYDDPDRDDELF